MVISCLIKSKPQSRCYANDDWLVLKFVLLWFYRWDTELWLDCHIVTIFRFCYNSFAKLVETFMRVLSHLLWWCLVTVSPQECVEPGWPSGRWTALCWQSWETQCGPWSFRCKHSIVLWFSRQTQGSWLVFVNSRETKAHEQRLILLSKEAILLFNKILSIFIKKNKHQYTFMYRYVYKENQRLHLHLTTILYNYMWFNYE